MATASRKRKLSRRYDTDDEVAFLRLKLDQERDARRELEETVRSLRHERTEMCIKMSELETTKLASFIPTSLIPLLTEELAKGFDPLRPAPSAVAPATLQKQPARTQASSGVRSQTTLRTPTRPVTATKTPQVAAPTRSLSAAGIRPAVRTPAPSSQHYTVVTQVPSTALKDPAGGHVINLSHLAAKLPGTAGSAQNFMIQQQTVDGKVVSYLVPVPPGTKGDNVVSAVMQPVLNSVIQSVPGASGSGDVFTIE